MLELAIEIGRIELLSINSFLSFPTTRALIVFNFLQFLNELLFMLNFFYFQLSFSFISSPPVDFLLQKFDLKNEEYNLII